MGQPEDDHLSRLVPSPLKHQSNMKMATPSSVSGQTAKMVHGRHPRHTQHGYFEQNSLPTSLLCHHLYVLNQQLLKYGHSIKGAAKIKGQHINSAGANFCCLIHYFAYEGDLQQLQRALWPRDRSKMWRGSEVRAGHQHQGKVVCRAGLISQFPL